MSFFESVHNFKHVLLEREGAILSCDGKPLIVICISRTGDIVDIEVIPLKGKFTWWREKCICIKIWWKNKISSNKYLCGRKAEEFLLENFKEAFRLVSRNILYCPDPAFRKDLKNRKIRTSQALKESVGNVRHAVTDVFGSYEKVAERLNIRHPWLDDRKRLVMKKLDVKEEEYLKFVSEGALSLSSFETAYRALMRLVDAKGDVRAGQEAAFVESGVEVFEQFHRLQRDLDWLFGDKLGQYEAALKNLHFLHKAFELYAAQFWQLEEGLYAAINEKAVPTIASIDTARFTIHRIHQALLRAARSSEPLFWICDAYFLGELRHCLSQMQSYKEALWQKIDEETDPVLLSQFLSTFFPSIRSTLQEFLHRCLQG